MDLLSLQQQTRRRRIAASARWMKAQTAALDVQLQQLRARTQAERLRLRQAMPEAHTWIIDLTAGIFVARDLDADAPPEHEAKHRHRAWEMWRGRL